MARSRTRRITDPAQIQDWIKRQNEAWGFTCIACGKMRFEIGSSWPEGYLCKGCHDEKSDPNAPR